MSQPMPRRASIGIIGIVLLIAGGVLYGIYGVQGGTGSAICGACVRVGIVMLALWLAFPQVSRVPPWIYGCSLAALIVIAAKPRAIIWVGPALVALWLLRPRPGKTSPAERPKRPVSNGR